MANTFRSYLSYVFGMAMLRKIIPTLCMLSFIGYIVYLVWLSLGPQKIVLDYRRQRGADVVVEKILEDIIANRGDVRSAVMLHFANDPTSYISETLRRKLNSTGILNLEDEVLLDRIKKKLNMRNRGVMSSEEALSAASGSDSQAVIWGKMDFFESFKDRTIITGEWQLIDIRSRTILYSGEIKYPEEIKISETEAAKPENINASAGEETLKSIKGMPIYVRLLGFLLFVLCFPIVTIAFLRTMVGKRSNRINAFVLGVYTCIDAILAFFMLGCRIASWGVAILFMAAVLFAFFYNVRLMSFALHLEEK